jgi:hypothetical protein
MFNPDPNRPDPYDPQNAIAGNWIPTIERNFLSLEIRAERLGFYSVAAMKEKYAFDANGKYLGRIDEQAK